MSWQVLDTYDFQQEKLTLEDILALSISRSTGQLENMELRIKLLTELTELCLQKSEVPLESILKVARIDYRFEQLKGK